MRLAVPANPPVATPPDGPEVQKRSRSVQLYALLGALTTGKAQQIVRALRTDRNGYEAWRQIVE
eukprot:2350803-Amphidinium_carterae.1